MTAAFQTQALALSGIQALWMLNDSGGTTGADVGPNNLPLTYSATKVSGAESINGAGSTFDGSSGITATRTVTAGSALDPTGAETICAWITPASFLTSAGASLIAGRTNHFRLQVNSFGSLGLSAWNGATVVDLRIAQNWAQSTKTYFIVAVYNGTVLRVYVNGEQLQESMNVGSLPSTTDSFVIGAASTPMQGTIGGVGVWNRRLTSGEIKDLWVAGTKSTPVTQALTYDNLYDSNTLIAAAAQGTRCTICGGKRRANEPVITHSGLVYHPSCYGAKAVPKALTVPTSASVPSDYEGPALRATHLMMNSQMVQVTDLAKSTWYDGTAIQPSASGLTKGYDIYGPYALTAAVVARQEKLSKQHWMVDLAITQTERVWSTQNSAGNLIDPTGGSGGADFVMVQLAEAIMFLKPYLTSDAGLKMLSRWKRNLRKLLDYFIANEANFYTNGNREAFYLSGLYLGYLALGDSVYLTAYNTQKTFIASTASGTGSADSAGNTSYGFITVTTPTQTDGSDGKGYFVERTSSHVGSVTPIGGGAVLDGFDPNYSLYQVLALGLGYVYSRDAAVLRWMNMIYNLAADYANMTSATVGDVPAWTLDGRGGSRQNNFATFGTPALPLLRWVGGQTRITAAQVAGAFNEAIRAWTVVEINSADISRDLNVNLGGWIRALPNWPGAPT